MNIDFILFSFFQQLIKNYAQKSKNRESEKTYMELMSIPKANLIALLRQLIQKQKPTEAVIPGEGGDAEEGDRRENRERELDNCIEGPLMAEIAVAAREHQVRHQRNSDVQQEKHRPRKPRPPQAGIV